jgi:hypothetical protein
MKFKANTFIEVIVYENVLTTTRNFLSKHTHTGEYYKSNVFYSFTKYEYIGDNEVIFIAHINS